MYALEQDRVTGLILITLEGFLSPAEAAELAREEQALAAAMTEGLGGHVVLFDGRESKIQPQEVVSAFQALMATSTCRARKIAIVTSGSLARSQARRIADERTKLFDTVEDGRCWLLTGANATANGHY